MGHINNESGDPGLFGHEFNHPEAGDWRFVGATIGILGLLNLVSIGSEQLFPGISVASTAMDIYNLVVMTLDTCALATGLAIWGNNSTSD